MQEHDEKVLFFGLEIEAPWPLHLPAGRHIQEKERHMTLAYLGKRSLSKVLGLASTMPKPSFSIGPTGFFDKCLFFPKSHSRCTAWHIAWPSQKPFLSYCTMLTHYLQQYSIMQKERKNFCPHVTICRRPFVAAEWEKAFRPLPLFCTAIHLYESLGNSLYQSHWKHAFTHPFEKNGTSFTIRGNTPSELHTNAKTALAFSFPDLTPCLATGKAITSLEESISDINRCASTHCAVQITPHLPLEWKMTIQKEHHHA